MNSVKRVAFYTLGCKVNQYETESIKKQLTDMGYEEVDFSEKAEIYVVNSCTVTSIADRKTRNILRRAKKNNEKAVVIATGCYAQTNAKDLEELPEEVRGSMAFVLVEWINEGLQAALSPDAAKTRGVAEIAA